MSNQPLGRLERVDLGTVWKNEATGFTPWLAREENLQILGDTLGLAVCRTLGWISLRIAG